MQYFCIFFLLFFLSSFAADSTHVEIFQFQAVGKVSVNVLHYSPNMEYYLSRSYLKCRDGGGSPFAVNFFLPNSAGVQIDPAEKGYFYFTCKETYWESDENYKLMKTHYWAPCHDGSPMMCSTKIARPELIRFIVTVPPESTDLNERKPMVFHGVNFRMGYALNMEPSSMGNTIKAPGFGPLVYTWYYPGNPHPWSTSNPIPEPQFNLQVTLYWMLTGDTRSSTPSNSSAWRPSDNKDGLYECSAYHTPGVLNNFPLNVNSHLFGKTCRVTCLGNWTQTAVAALKRAGQETWYSVSPEITCQ